VDNEAFAGDHDEQGAYLDPAQTAAGVESVELAEKEEYERKYAQWFAHQQAYNAQQAAAGAGALPPMAPPGYAGEQPAGAMRMPFAPPRPGPY